MSKIDRKRMVVLLKEALENLGKEAHLIDVSKELWKLLLKDGISEADDIFYTWQYDMRWASQTLRNRGDLEKSNVSSLPKGVWRLK